MGKLKSLDLSTKKGLIKSKSKVQAQSSKTLSLNKKLTMLNISKTAYYYKPIEPYSKQCEIELLHEIDEIYTKYPYYSTRRMKEALKRNGFKVGRKKLKKAYEILNIQAIYPKKKTTMANKEHHKYPYLLEKLRTRDKKTGKETIAVKRPNQVWSADITYVRLQNGYAYLAVIIDWYSKKILAYKLGNMMEVRLTVSALREALRKHGRLKIFNTDQGSQYTAQEHIKILKENGIEISMNSRGAEHR
ncbi:IS3 family transposase [Peptococcaceae bacterium]|nr:IS3 family transposase [Peptococcaceae bacterium]MCL0100687.1 IS3 family transposase [Peptococcaceae bacterium]